jgi:hypothetical protein
MAFNQELPIITAANTSRLQAEAMSYPERGLAFTAGAVTSGLYSIYNSVASGVNFFGGDMEKADTAATLRSVDENWGSYYDQNKSAIDTVGFVAASLIPSTLAVKGLNMLRYGEAVGPIGRVLGYTATKQSSYLNAAMKELATDGGTIFTQLNRNFLKSVTWGIADNALQSAAATIATAATLHASPMFEGKDMGDIAWEVARDTMIGGAIGGAVEGLFAKGIYKQAATLIDSNIRKVDRYVSDSAKDLAFGDKAFDALTHISSIPDDVLKNVQTKVSYGWTLSGQKFSTEFDLSGIMDAKVRAVSVKALNEFEQTVRDGAGDALAGSALAGSFIKLRKEGIERGVSDHDVNARIGGTLLGLSKAESIGEGAASIFKGEALTFAGNGYLSARKFSSLDEAKKFFRMEATVTEDEVLAMAKRSGYDGIAIQGTGKATIEEVKSTGLDITNSPKIFYNAETGAHSFSTLATIGDVSTTKSPVLVTSRGITAGSQTVDIKLAYNPEDPISTIEATARHLWASELDASRIPTSINPEDISLLERIRINPEGIPLNTKIGELKLNDIFTAGGYSKWLVNHKADLLKDYIVRYNSPDIQELAYRLNATQDWVQTTIANDFKAVEAGAFKDLNSYRSPENLKLSYADGARKPDFLDAYVDHKQRMQIAEEKLVTAAKTVLGNQESRFIAPDSSFADAANATRQGAGASLFGSSNAGYENKLGSFVQYTGSQVELIGSERANTAALALQGTLTKILQNPSKAAELAAISNVARSTDEKLVMMTVEQGMPGNYLVSRAMAELAGEDPEAFVAWKEAAIAGQAGKEKLFKIADDDVASFMQQWIKNNDIRMEQRGVLANAHGLGHNHEPGTFYAPPIDTTKQPFFAFVKAKDGAVFGRTDVGVLTAKTEADLMKLSARVKSEGFDVWFKQDGENFFKAKGEYEYGRTLNESGINSELKRRGVFFEFMPNMNPESVVSEFLNYTRRAEHALVRDAVSTKYHSLFAELGNLSEEYTKAATSKTGWLSKIASRTVDDPYGDYVRTALNISKRAEYPILQQTNDFIDAVGVRAYRAINAGYQEMKSGKLSWEEAGPMLRRYGLGESFKDESLFTAAQSAPDKNIIRAYIGRANALIATTNLRLDFLNPIVNVLSTPVMASAEIQSLRKLVSKDPELAAIFEGLTKVNLPDGSGRAMQSTGKLMAEATANYWKYPERIELYKSIGAIDGTMNLHRRMIDELGAGVGVEASKLGKWLENAASKGEAITGNKFAEQFTRFVSADMMYQLTEGAVKKGLMSPQERNSFINIFVNRVQGNYLASQRPILFQGTTGAAIGMFQTYTFNMLQQLFRHVENRDAAAMATMLGMQTSIYGLNGLPGFDAINTHIIGNGKLNSSHADMYTKASEIFGKEYGEWLMFGSASAMPFFSNKAPALYTRGDINPRYLTIVPTNPKDVPAFAAGVKVYDLISNFADGISGDGSVKATFLQGLEHNGLSRPLAGLGAVLQGASTTGKGNMISANNDLLSIATLSRLAGAKPMDESIARNEQFRQLAYKAKDRAKLERLAYEVKTKIINGEDITPEDSQRLLSRYAESGGRIENYGTALKGWMKDATTSQISQIMDNHRNPYARRMIEIMGGERLDMDAE